MRLLIEIALILLPCSAFLLGVGLSMWTGRWKSWYAPHDYNRQFSYAFTRTSPTPTLPARGRERG
jgi:hypothetical protein